MNVIHLALQANRSVGNMRATADVAVDDDGNAHARLRNSVPLGVNIDDPDDVVALVNPERLKSKRPRRGLGNVPGRK